jgi:hypothetical protein
MQKEKIMNRTITIEDRYYIIAPMRFGQSRDIFSPGIDPFDSNCAMVAACLNNADDGKREPSDIEALPYPDGNALVFACLDLCGLRPGASGEAPAAPKTEP